jgi:predicted nucleic acid-binding protein
VIIVDTSVWVDAFRSPSAQVAVGLTHLIDADEACVALPVRLELLSGLGRERRPVVRRALTALPVVVPTEETWQTVDRWIDMAADAGQRFAIIDLLIAALAHDLTALVWSLDGDFERMADLGFVGLYR